MDEQQLLSELTSKMSKAVAITRDDLATIRTGTAAPSLVENIQIPVYGGSQKMKVMELATVTSPDSNTLNITPFDKSILEEMVKGLQEAKLGFNPSLDGDIIRITIPPLSEEQRREYVRFAKVKLEHGRVMIRQVRHEAMSKLKKAFEGKVIAEDARKRLEKNIQEVTNDHTSHLDAMGKAKEKELLSI